MNPTESSAGRFGPHDLSGRLLRAARALAGVKAEDLAAHSKLGLATIKRAEASEGPTRLTEANAERLIEALEHFGVEMVWGEAGAHGVRLKPSSADT